MPVAAGEGINNKPDMSLQRASNRCESLEGLLNRFSIRRSVPSSPWL